MKKHLLILSASVLSYSVMAQSTDRPRHLVSFGTDGFGWSSSATMFDLNKDKAQQKDKESSHAEFNLNYSYIFESRIMLGAKVAVETDNSKYKNLSGQNYENNTTSSSFGLTLGYNFNEDLFNSWWITAGLGTGKIKTLTKDPSATPVKDENDSNLSYFSFEVGKRFSFESWGLKNLTYAPSIEFVSISYKDDLKAAGLKSSTTAQINLLKFDVLW